MDAPRHTKLRGLVSAAFTPRQIARIEDGIRVNAQRIVREASATGGGDFVELFAKRLPLQTISDMLGVPAADRERVVQAADTLVCAARSEVFGDRDPLEVLGSALWTLTEFATELAKHRELHPGDDLMTALVQAEVDGDRLTHAEIAAFLVLLSVAGNDTTRHTTSHAMRALTCTPSSGRCCSRTWTGGCRRGRGVRPLGLAGDDVPADDHPRRRAPRRAAGGRARRWSSSTTRAIATNGRLTTRGASTSRATRTSTWASAAADRTTASAPRWRAPSCGAIFGEMLRASPDIEVGEPEPLRSRSSTASSGCPAASPRAPSRRAWLRVRCGRGSGARLAGETACTTSHFCFQSIPSAIM